MAERHVVSALVAKRAGVKREIEAAERRLAQRRADLMHLDATLRLFRDGAGPDDEAARPAPQRRWFRNGELARRGCWTPCGRPAASP